jgi:DNA repair exonuclease SbcCD ATPase subunit
MSINKSINIEEIIDNELIYPIIYHMADIHITNNTDRYEEFDKVFKKVYDILEKDPRDKIIIIAGDLFDNKITFKTYTLTFVSLFISNLVKYGDVILLDGNHDVNMSNENIESTISSMLTLSRKLNINKMNQIHYLNENKIYKIKGINFGLTTMFTKEVTKIQNKNINEIYIGLYHGKVYGAKTDLNYKIDENNCNFKTTHFKDYDIVCLGDIHKHQFLDKNKRIAYSSSLIQKDFGETVKLHGLIIWDLNKLEGNFISIPNEYCMINCKIEDKKLNINEDINLEDYKYIKAKITYKKEEIKNIDKFEKKLKNKYNFKEITMYEEITITNDENMAGKISDNIKEVLDEYIKKSLNKEEEKNEMKQIIYKIIDENDLDIERNMKKIELNSLYFNNLFCYGIDNQINFNKLNKIVGIVADNGWGKSSIIDALLYTIYQRCARTKGTKVLNKFKTSSIGILEFKINDIPYEIKRTIKKLKTKNEEILEIKKNNVNINSDYKKNTNKMIEDIFGTYEDLTDNNIMLQNSNNFINKTEKEKKETMYKIFGIEAYDKLYQIIKNKILELKKQIDRENKKLLNIDEEKKINDSIRTKSNDLKIINIDYQKICDQLINQNYFSIQLKNIIANQNNQNNISNEYIQCTKELENKNKELKNYNEFNNIYNLSNNLTISNSLPDSLPDKFYKDIEFDINNLDNLKNNIIQEKLKKKNIIEIVDIKNKIKILENNKITMSESTSLINLINEKNNEKSISDIRLELKKLSNILVQYESTKKILEESTKENKYLLEHKFNNICDECIHNKKIHEKINYIEKINELKDFIIKNTEINVKINNMEREQIEKEQLKELKEKVKNIEKENININELIDINNMNKEYELNNKEIDIKLVKLENEYNILNDKYKKKLKDFKDFNLIMKSIKKLSEQKNNLEKLKENLINNEIEINILKENTKDMYININKKKEYEILIKQIEKDIILLQTNLDYNNKNLEEIILLRNEINKYNNIYKLFTEDKIIEKLLNQIINNTEIIINNILKDLTNFTLKFEINQDGVSIYKNFDGELIDAKFLSGYEMFVSNIALRIAFGKLNRYIRTNFMIIDEGFASCSNTNIIKINNVFDIIRKYYKWCIVVSHLDQIKDNFDHSYNITKINNTNDSQIII